VLEQVLRRKEAEGLYIFGEIETTLLEKPKELEDRRREWEKLHKSLDDFWASNPQKVLAAAGAEKEADQLTKDATALSDHIVRRHNDLQQQQKKFESLANLLLDDKPAALPAEPAAIVEPTVTQTAITVMKPLKFRAAAVKP
jgi:hypothetical protein